MNHAIHFPLRPTKIEEDAFLEYLDSLFTDVRSPVAYTGAQEVLNYIKRDGRYSNVGLTRLKKYMSRFDGYTLNVERRRPRQFRRYVADLPGVIEIDLMTVTRHSKFNQDIQYLVVGIDQCSRETHIAFLVDKTGGVVREGVLAILKKFNNKVHAIYCDYGVEFRTHTLLEAIADLGIRIYYAKQNLKAVLVERQIRFLRMAIRRFMEQNHTSTYLEIIEQIVDNYNNRRSKKLAGLSPLEVNNYTAGRVADYRRSVWIPRPRVKRFEFKIQSNVRMLTEKLVFHRYRENYSREIFRIHDRFEKDGLEIYVLEACDSEVIDGFFYSQELEAVKLGLDTDAQIDKYITEERRQGVPYVLVQYKGVGSKGQCREWLRKADLNDQS